MLTRTANGTFGFWEPPDELPEVDDDIIFFSIEANRTSCLSSLFIICFRVLESSLNILATLVIDAVSAIPSTSGDEMPEELSVLSSSWKCPTGVIDRFEFFCLTAVARGEHTGSPEAEVE